jgi:hypothetical protein
MGAPISSILADIHKIYRTHTNIPYTSKQQIIAYYRYVDDILIIYNQNKTNIDHTLNEFTKLQHTIKFTIEKVQQDSINCLDIGIHRKDNSLQYSIYRKPTQTDIIILWRIYADCC